MSYLSIDLDYWMDYRRPKSATEFFKKVFAADVPLTVVMDHDELIASVNSKNFEHLINMDRHSDLSETPSQKLTVGNWVNYVDWRTEGAFTWLRPPRSGLEYGRCHGLHDPFKKKQYCEWGLARISKDRRIINWDTVEHIGVSLSPDWVQMNSILDVCFQLVSRKPEFKSILKRASTLEGRTYWRDDSTKSKIQALLKEL